jgi:hypothetical protein
VNPYTLQGVNVLGFAGLRGPGSYLVRLRTHLRVSCVENIIPTLYTDALSLFVVLPFALAVEVRLNWR